MAVFLQTSSGVEGLEGNDQLKDFFEQNNKLKLEWYNKLVEDDIDYDDLMDSDDNDLIKLLESCGLKSKAVIRIRNAVRKIPDSVSYKALHNINISMVSTQELEAAKNIENESEKITNAITNISNIINTLNANSKYSEIIINNTFDNIISNVNKRRNILLKQLKNNKQNQLSAQKITFHEKVKQLNALYEQTQYMMKDTNIDINKRKIKILSNSKQIFDTNIQLLPNSNDNNLNEMISTFGMIIDGNGALAPNIKIKNISNNCVVIIIENNIKELECLTHEIQYIESNNNYKDDEKLEWISLYVNNNNNISIEYEIKTLKPLTKYMIRAKSQNKNGWGIYSKCISFKTKNMNPNKEFVISQMVFDSFGIDSNIIQIVNSKQVKCLKSGASNNGGSVRMKFGMPTKYSNTYGLKSISWKITPTIITGWAVFCMGVVSNRATKMIAAYNGLKDAYGINDRAGWVYKGNPQNKSRSAYCKDNNYNGFKNNETFRIEYNINKSILKYFKENEISPIYTIELPQNVKTITHWYPFVSLCYKNDVCRVYDVVVT